MLRIAFLICISLTCLQAQRDFSRLGDDPQSGQYIQTRGIQLYYESYGAGEPLLFIHGNSGSIAHFQHQIPYFASRYRVIAVDSRAQGKSVDPSDSLSYEMMADDLNALLDSLKTGPCRVIGWSDGGINGLLLAIRHPDKVRQLAITGANLWPDSTAVDPFIAQWALEYNRELSSKPPTPTILNERKLARLLSYEPQILPAQLAGIQCPALIMGGDNDVIRPEHTLLIARSIPQAYLWIVPGAGHSIPWNFKEIFNQTVDQFFSRPFKKFEGLDKMN